MNFASQCSNARVLHSRLLSSFSPGPRQACIPATPAETCFQSQREVDKDSGSIFSNVLLKFSTACARLRDIGRLPPLYL
jgi:hypothetical protein